MIPTANIVITGVSFPRFALYKHNDGTIKQMSSVYLRTPNGHLVEPKGITVISATPRAIAYNEVTLTGVTNITGMVVPVNASVKVSAYIAPSDHWGEELEANLICEVPANEYGEFSISFNGREETVLVWCDIPCNYDSVNCGIDISISYATNEGGEETTGTYLIQTNYQCGSYNAGDATDAPTFTISGTCPEDTTQVYISANPGSVPEGSDYETELTNNILYSAVPENSAYRVNFHEPISTTNIVVWCISEIQDAHITVSYTVDVGSINSAVCLSGDTPILLYDGTKKALRDLTLDDVLMAGDYTPTQITKITRGIVSDYHTLYLFDDGTIIDEAHRHRFFNVDAGYWMYLDEWKIGDRAKKCDGSTPKLVRVERVDEPCRRYGLWTESHDYYAGNLLSGETAANQSVLADATLEQAADMVATLDADKLDKLYKGVLG